MSNGNGFSAWKDRVAWSATIGIGMWNSWLTLDRNVLKDEINDRPTKEEVIRDIETTAPYVKERELIINALARIDKTEERLSRVIENNTEAVNELRVHLVKVETTLHRK